MKSLSEGLAVESQRQPKGEPQKKMGSLEVVPVKMMFKVRNLVGQKFGLLIVESLAGRTRNRKSVWNCKCFCGEKTMVLGDHLKGDYTKSCGCLTKNFGMTNITHGHTTNKNQSKTYTCWINMRDRCLNPKCRHYSNYGGRGIKICERWGKFKNFLKDMGEQPLGMMIERKDNNGNYDPSNCKWATREEQMNNARFNVTNEFKGKKQTAIQWARELNLNVKRIYKRASKRWPSDKILDPRSFRK